jgi:hypothetical protein
MNSRYVAAKLFLFKQPCSCWWERFSTGAVRLPLD